MKITQCLHTAIMVADLKKAEYFYGTMLKLPKVNRKLKHPGAWYQIGDYQIHLILDQNCTKTLANWEKWGRNPHFALAVDNLEEVKQCLQANGYSFQLSASGRAALFTQDPDGNIIEISQVELFDEPSTINH